MNSCLEISATFDCYNDIVADDANRVQREDYVTVEVSTSSGCGEGDSCCVSVNGETCEGCTFVVFESKNAPLTVGQAALIMKMEDILQVYMLDVRYAGELVPNGMFLCIPVM